MHRSPARETAEWKEMGEVKHLSSPDEKINRVPVSSGERTRGKSKFVRREAKLNRGCIRPVAPAALTLSIVVS